MHVHISFVEFSVNNIKLKLKGEDDCICLMQMMTLEIQYLQSLKV